MLYEKIIQNQGFAFEHRSFVLKHFPVHWHHHDEYELILITSGRGKRFVAERISRFEPGDLVLIGPNIPHFHLCDSEYFENNDLKSSSEVIYFTDKIFPGNMENMPEFSSIVNLLKNSKLGIKFENKGFDSPLIKRFLKLDHKGGFPMVMELYSILYELSKSNTQTLLRTEDTAYISDDAMKHPGNRAYAYITNNFKKKITLNEIAEFAGLTPAALCRSFKQTTGKSLFATLNEIRINFSFKLLAGSSLAVSIIAYESGFQNVSHFNRVFKEQTGITPLEYKRRYKLK